MPVYRHATNMTVPIGATDLNLLSVLSDYRIGAPMAPNPRETDPYPPVAGDLLTYGYVGIYTTREALKAQEVMSLTGWRNPDVVLTVPWRPLNGVAPKDAQENA